MIQSLPQMSFTLSVDDYLALEEPQTWLIEPLIPVGGRFLLYGDPKIGKPFLALQLAESLAGHRLDWLGFPVLKTGPVLYLQLDTARALWQARIRTLRTHGMTLTGVRLSDQQTLGVWPFDILNPTHAAILHAAVEEVKPVAVIVDVLKETNHVDENSADEMQMVVAELTASTHPAALVVLHHAKKPMAESAPNLLADLRGTSYLPGAVDTIMRLTEKAVYFVGRAVEGGVVYTQRQANGLILPMAETTIAQSGTDVKPIFTLDPDTTLEWDQESETFKPSATFPAPLPDGAA